MKWSEWKEARLPDGNMKDVEALEQFVGLGHTSYDRLSKIVNALASSNPLSAVLALAASVEINTLRRVLAYGVPEDLEAILRERQMLPQGVNDGQD